jgi:sugar/nucleoside kinase (ribokinase family)
VLYMEGYLYDRDEAKAAFRHAAGVAHEAGRMVSLTLSDSFCVDRHRDDFLSLVADEVDLLFGNEDELCSLYETDTFDEPVAELRRTARSRRSPSAPRARSSSTATTSSRCRPFRSAR